MSVASKQVVEHGSATGANSPMQTQQQVHYSIKGNPTLNGSNKYQPQSITYADATSPGKETRPVFYSNMTFHADGKMTCSNRSEDLAYGAKIDFGSKTSENTALNATCSSVGLLNHSIGG